MVLSLQLVDILVVVWTLTQKSSFFFTPVLHYIIVVAPYLSHIIICQANALTTVLARSLSEMRIGSGKCSNR